MRKRTGRPQRFAAIPNTTIDDALNLDLTALGLLAVLLRHRDGWEITLKDIGARYGYGEDALARAMGLLQVARYVVKIRIMSAEGNRWSTEVVVYDTPATDEEIAALLDEIAHEPGVRQVQLIPPTKTALAYAEKRRNRLSPDSGFSRSRDDLRKHGKTPGRPDSGVFRDPGNPGVSKKTSSTEDDSSSCSSSRPSSGPMPQAPKEGEEKKIGDKGKHTASDLPMCQSGTPATGGHGEAAAALIAELPTIATRAGRPIRPLLPGETSRLAQAVTAAIARGWTPGQIRAVLEADLDSARSVVATWLHRLRGLGDPPAPVKDATAAQREAQARARAERAEMEARRARDAAAHAARARAILAAARKSA